MDRRTLTRRKFLSVSGFCAAGLLAGCSADRSAEPPAGGSETPPEFARLSEAVVSGGPGRDGIPPIDDPHFVPAKEMNGLLDPEDVVFILDYGGEVKVYPQPVLVWHEIANDTVAGEKLSVTYCPLTGSTVAFKGRSPEGEPLTFGTTGRLVNSNLLMYDRTSESEWPQILGRAITGPLAGDSLTEIPLLWTTWQRWKERGDRAAPVLSTRTGVLRSYGSDPYGSYSASEKGYYANDNLLFQPLNKSDRFPPKEIMIGVKSGPRRTAFRKTSALEKGVWNFEVGNTPMVALGNPSLKTVEVFERSLDNRPGEVFEFRGRDGNSLFDRAGGVWKREGPGLRGPGGVELPAANFYEVMWFAWYAFFPETRVLV